MTEGGWTPRMWHVLVGALVGALPLVWSQTAHAGAELLTPTIDGAPLNGATSGTTSNRQITSADGRYVVFASSATNLVAGDTNGQADVFVRDRRTGTTELVSVSSEKLQGNASSGEPTISADGRTVAFVSFATNLAPADGNGGGDVFVRDLEAGTTELVSVGTDGRQGDGSFIGDASLSADGRFVAFQTPGSLADGDWSFNYDVYVRDRLTATTTWASDAGGFSRGAYDPMMSADGSAVAFWTSAPFAPDDVGGKADIYVRDLRPGGGFERVSVGDDEQQGDDNATYYPAISADGRYVAFTSWAGNLVDGDTNRAVDGFVRDRVAGTTERFSLGGARRQLTAETELPQVSADGRFVSFRYGGSDLIPAAGDGFLRDRTLDRTRTVRGLQAPFTVAPAGNLVVFDSDEDHLPGNGPDSYRTNLYAYELPPSEDATPPALRLPATVAAPARDVNGARVRYDYSVTDDTDPSPDHECVPHSGDDFPLGRTTVDCLGVDEAGNEALGSFVVDVRDRAPPRPMLPESVELDAASASGAVYDFEPRAEDNVELAQITCEPASGHEFPIGTTTVSCVAIDAAGNEAHGGFDVRVRPPRDPVPRASVSDVRVPERIGSAQLQVTLDRPVSSDLDLPVDLVPGTASAPWDYDDAVWVTIAAGSQRASIDVPIRDDHADEPLETFDVVLDGAAAGLPNARGTVSIVDDDAPHADRRRPSNGPLVFVDRVHGRLMSVDPSSAGAQPTVLHDDPLGVGEPSVAPDGDQVLFYSGFDGSYLRRVGILGGDAEPLGDDEFFASLHSPVWRPDGAAYAYLTSSRLVVQPVDGEGAFWVRLQDANRISWAPDGSRLVFDYYNDSTESSDLGIVDADTGQVSYLTETTRIDEQAPAWAPDGSAIAFERSAQGGGRTLADLALMPPSGGQITTFATDAGERRPAWSPDSRRIAFVRPLENGSEIRSIARDGTDERLHVSAEHYAYDVDWGAAPRTGPTTTGRIVFAEGDATGRRIVAVDGDGGGRRNLSEPGTDSQPRLSQDGSVVAFSSARDGGEPEIYAMTAAGRDQRRLTADGDPSGDPDPSPDGRSVVYARAGTGGSDLWVIDGEAQTRLTADAGSEADPAWSPDGERIAYTGGAGGPDPEIRLIDPDGGGRERLVRGLAPSWSPDGKRLAFVRLDDAGVPQVWTIAIDGSGERRLTSLPTGALSPSFAPDGTAIAFQGADGIFAMHDDGTSVTRLTTGAHTDPDWGPRAPLPKLSLRDVTVAEGAVAHFEASLSFAPDEPVRVRLATTDGTAAAGEDYTAVSGVEITFPPGERTRTVDVPVSDDPYDEPDESFSLEASGLENATAANPLARATITDDDDPPALSVDDITVAETDLGLTQATFTLRLSERSGWNVAIDTDTEPGTATAPADYENVHARVVFTPGQTTRTVSVPVRGDTMHESDETFRLLLTRPEHVTVQDAEATATIVDDDESGELPETAIAAGPAGPTNDATPTFVFFGSVFGGAFECRIADAAFATCTSPFTAGPLADGDYELFVRALDGALADPTPARREFTVDTVAPATTITAAPARVTRNASVTFELSAGEPESALECRLWQGGAPAGFAPCPARVERGPLADGDWTFEARATDRAGNVDPTPAAYRFRVDTTPPDTGFEDPQLASRPLEPAAIPLGGSAALTISATGEAALPVSCPLSAAGFCTGTITLYEPGGAAARTAAVKSSELARTSFRVAPGATARVPVALPPTVRYRVERAGRLGVMAVVVTEDDSGESVETRRALTLTPDTRFPRSLDAGLRVAVHRGVAQVRLACLRGRCEGRFSLAASAGAGPRYGAKRFSIRRGAVARLRVALTRRASVALRDTRRLSVLATITVLRPGAPALVKRVELTLVEKGGTR